jgi:hypothetical protein
VTLGRRGRASFSDFWDVTLFQVSCGTLQDLAFQPDDEACNLPVAKEGVRSVELRAPKAPGTWTLELGVCAQQTVVDAQNELCGPWYVALRVRE